MKLAISPVILFSSCVNKILIVFQNFTVIAITSELINFYNVLKVFEGLKEI